MCISGCLHPKIFVHLMGLLLEVVLEARQVGNEGWFVRSRFNVVLILVLWKGKVRVWCVCTEGSESW